MGVRGYIPVDTFGADGDREFWIGRVWLFIGAHYSFYTILPIWQDSD
ncbi:hypothetical protein UY416_25540 [Paenibacillus polymyxa]|nr:hypothetical protein [Paenibacillus polymyxa]MDY8049657.1 hypothetical protein [Paenibacillus polymyxa]